MHMPAWADQGTISVDWANAAESRIAPAEVIHERWGEGVVTTVSGLGDDAEATISFSDVGEKRVLLAYAPLTKVG